MKRNVVKHEAKEDLSAFSLHGFETLSAHLPGYIYTHLDWPKPRQKAVSAPGGTDTFTGATRRANLLAPQSSPALSGPDRAILLGSSTRFCGAGVPISVVRIAAPASSAVQDRSSQAGCCCTRIQVQRRGVTECNDGAATVLEGVVAYHASSEFVSACGFWVSLSLNSIEPKHGEGRFPQGSRRY